jgi:hypothetical protein
MRSSRPNPPVVLIQGVALAGILIWATRLTGPPPSTRITFSEQYRTKYGSQNR